MSENRNKTRKGTERTFGIIREQKLSPGSHGTANAAVEKKDEKGPLRAAESALKSPVALHPSAKMGDVIKGISSRAQTIDMLVAGTTEEAPRVAGAQENLSQRVAQIAALIEETAEITHSFDREFAVVETNLQPAVQAAGLMAGILRQVRDMTNQLVVTVEAQTARTNELVGNVGRAAEASTQVARNMLAISGTTRTLLPVTPHQQPVEAELARLNAELQSVLTQFKRRCGDIDNAGTGHEGLADEPRQVN
jgi:methyl-accepting chemotaxis protein